MLLVFLVLLAMSMILAMGTVMMELLFRDAPRRGKRPDIQDDSPNCETVLRVTTTDGDTLVGKPLPIVARLIADGFSPSPRHLTAPVAERLLREWERQGIVHIRGEWREKQTSGSTDLPAIKYLPRSVPDLGVKNCTPTEQNRLSHRPMR